MSRVALIVGPDAGHALPVLGVGSELARRGHDVTVWTSGDHAPLAADLGIGWRQLPAIAPTPGDVDAGHRLWGRAAPMAEQLAPELDGHDLVVADTLTTGGALAAGLCDLPHVEVIPHHLPDPADDLPAVGLGRRPARTDLGRHLQARLVAQQRLSVATGRAQAAGVARQVGLPGWPRPAARLLQTLPALERPRRDWPADAHIVGPLAVDPALPPLTPPEGDAPLVVVTDSTATGLADRALTARVADALHGLDLRLVLTTGQLPAARTSQVVIGKGPHAPLLAHADLLVSPGGGGVLTKGVAAGVRHVVVPLAGDQREAAARVVDAGLGRRVSPRGAWAWRLRQAVVLTLADRRAAARAAEVAASAAAYGPSLAADRCEQVLAGRCPAATPPHLHGVPATR